MTHDRECKFDPKYCRDCKLQAEARADERYESTMRLLDAYNKGPKKKSFANLRHTIELYDAINAIGAQESLGQILESMREDER